MTISDACGDRALSFKSCLQCEKAALERRHNSTVRPLFCGIVFNKTLMVPQARTGSEGL